MSIPKMSKHFLAREPSSIRLAQIEYSKRTDKTSVINTAIGNVSLPIHPAMKKRMFNLDQDPSPHKDGIVRYTSTKGLNEANQAFLNILGSSEIDTSTLYSQITDGGSQCIELILAGLTGNLDDNQKEAPLLLIDAAYTNYMALAERLGKKTISVTRTLQKDGTFSLPDTRQIEETIIEHKPNALIVIPYDNPTGQFFNNDKLTELAKLCVKHNLWLVSDEAYRELYYTEENSSSIWKISEEAVPGITGRRISIETSSKVWNACGLRIGALITDNKTFNEKAVAENTANLCSNAIGQYIFGSLAEESQQDLQAWCSKQRNYYKEMLISFNNEIKRQLPSIIISSPSASIYSVIDVRDIVGPDFNATDFVLFCAKEGFVTLPDGEKITLLTAPMSGFYNGFDEKNNPGRTQMRIAFVEGSEKMKMVPFLFKELLQQYEQK